LYICFKCPIIKKENNTYVLVFCRTHASLTNDSTLKDLIIGGECNLVEERLSLLKLNDLRKYLIQIIEDIGLINVTDDNLDVLLRVCSEYKRKQHAPCSEHCSAESITSLLIKLLCICYYF